MKLATRKYVRLLDSQSKLYNKQSKLLCYGDNWRKEKDKSDKLQEQINICQSKLDSLTISIEQNEFEIYLSDRMCCTWDEFIGNY
jgi:hypothetical protein